MRERGVLILDIWLVASASECCTESNDGRGRERQKRPLLSYLSKGEKRNKGYRERQEQTRSVAPESSFGAENESEPYLPEPEI